MSADRGENHDPTGDISRTDGKGCSKGLTRIPGIREQCLEMVVTDVKPFQAMDRVEEIVPAGAERPAAVEITRAERRSSDRAMMP